MILVDTSVWSLALRGRPHQLSAAEHKVVARWRELVEDGTVCLIGMIRQEILSGIREPATFSTLRSLLADFVYLTVPAQCYDLAAEQYNRCMARGIAATAVDMLICAVAARHRVPVFSVDRDFERYAKVLAVKLYTS